MSVKQVAVEKAIKLLSSTGASYHIMFEGMEFGSPIKPPSAKRVVQNHGVVDHIKRHTPDRLSAGDLVVYPATADYPLPVLQSSASSFMSRLLGAGNHVTCRNVENNTLEVLITGNDNA